jgi:hypothetical protein
MSFSFLWRHAGLISLWTERWSLHIGVKFQFWQWEPHDRDLLYTTTGVGPALLLAWENG